MFNFVRIVAVRVSTTLPTAILKLTSERATSEQATSERAEGII